MCPLRLCLPSTVLPKLAQNRIWHVGHKHKHRTCCPVALGAVTDHHCQSKLTGTEASGSFPHPRIRYLSTSNRQILPGGQQISQSLEELFSTSASYLQAWFQRTGWVPGWYLWSALPWLYWWLLLKAVPQRLDLEAGAKGKAGLSSYRLKSNCSSALHSLGRPIRNSSGSSPSLLSAPAEARGCRAALHPQTSPCQRLPGSGCPPALSPPVGCPPRLKGVAAGVAAPRVAVLVVAAAAGAVPKVIPADAACGAAVPMLKPPVPA